MPISANNIAILNAAFARVKFLESVWDDEIPWNAISEGFNLSGEKVHLATKARGIFKPRQMARGLLSIRTAEPRLGRTNIYQDAETAEGFYRYSLQRGDPRNGGNKHLWEAWEDRQPFIYFHAVAESIYKAIWPCFVDAIYPDAKYCSIIVGVSRPLSQEPDKPVIYQVPLAPERAYAMRESRIRLFQAVFRENVLSAYDNRCAVSGLPVKQLLDAAHITPDSEADSSTEVTNGIALSKLHHRAYDSNLIGIDPDLRVVVSEQLRGTKDGVMLEGLKVSHGSVLRIPRIAELRPDRERLARRFELFSSANK